MNFQNPTALLWLLPLAGVIVALYLLKMRRRDVQVPAVFLWPQRTDEIRANSLFQKLKFSWLLVLQLLALALIIVVLTRPQVVRKGLSGRVTVIVLDASASMGATDTAPSRFDRALEVARDLVQTATTGDRVALIEAGPVPRVVFPLTEGSSKQIRQMETVRRSDAESDMGEAMRLAAAVAGGHDGAKIVVLSDGVFERVDNFAPGKASVVYQQFGSSSGNLAIQALGSTVGNSGRLAYCGIKNTGEQPARTSVTVWADGKTVDSQEVTLGPQKAWGKSVLVPAGTKVIEAKLSNGGHLAADDYAVTVTDPGASVRVLLVTKGDLFLERALALDPRVSLDKSERVPESERAGSSGPARYDIVVFDSVRPVSVKSPAVWAFGAPGEGSPVTGGSTAKNPEFLDAADHPLMDGVSFDGVYIETQFVVRTTGQGRVLAESRKGPLVVASSGRQRHVYVAFEPMESDFPLSVGFPIFVGNALDFLAGKESADLFAVTVGRPFSVPAAQGQQVTVTRPDKSVVEVPARDGRAIVRAADRIGAYAVQIGGTKKTVLASLRSPMESSISPRENISMGTTVVKAAGQVVRFEDLWRWVLLLGLCVLGFEWFYFARRS